MTNTDPVNKPVHYNQAGIECIDAIEAMTENMSGYILDGLLNDYSGSTININGENIERRNWKNRKT